MLLKAAELLAAAGELPVNVRFACDGEEEIGGHSIVDWLAEDERGADAARDLRQRHDGPRRARVQHRHARPLLLPRRGPHGRARPPLGHVRRRRAERDARADADARRLSCRATGGCPSRCGQGSCPPLPRSSRAGRRSSRAARRSPAQGARPLDGRGGRGVLPPHLGRALRRRARHRGRVADAPEDGAARARGRERLDPARAGPGARGDRGRVRAAAARGRARGRRARCRPLLVRARRRSCRPTRAPSSSRSTRSSTCSAGGRCSSARAARSRSCPRSPTAASRPIVTGFALPESNIHSPNERLLVGVPPARSRDGRGALPPLGATAWLARLTPSPLARQELAADVLERFLRYVRIDTPAAVRIRDGFPSTSKQLDLSRLLLSRAASARARRTPS